MSNKIDANSWEFTQKIIRIGHNRRVKKYFRDIKSDTGVTSGRGTLKTALLIRDDDSALECLNKQMYFQNNLDQKEVITAYPEDFQVRAEVSRPQLVIIFKPKEKKTDNWQYNLSIPHYAGSRTLKFKKYTKGNFWARAILKDNSHIRVNARTQTEAVTLTKKLLRLVDKKYRVGLDNIKTGEYINKPFRIVDVYPYRADYFPRGKLSPYPKWQHYF